MSLLKSLPRWAQIVAPAIALGGVLFGAVSYLSPLGAIDLTVWIQQEVPINLPTDAHLPLVLTYGGENIRRATLMKVRLSNTGSTPIGADSEWWTLTIKSPDGARVVSYDAPTPNPGNLKLHMRQPQPPDSVEVGLGLFNPGDHVDLKLLIIDPKTVEGPVLVAQTRVPKLREPTVTRQSLEERVTRAFMVPLAVISSLLILIVQIWRGASRGNFSSFSKSFDVVVTAITAAVIIGPLFGIVVGVILGKVVLFQLGR